MQKPYFFLIIVLGLGMSSCKTLYPTYPENQPVPSTDYSNLDHWAAHPDKTDPADSVPGQEALSDQSDLPVDVFFLHPTIYTKFKGDHKWNASLDDASMNKSVDESTILYQASAFNKVGRVFAPRYRQAHIYGYTTGDKAAALEAFAIAYKDVKEAFEYYMEHYNNGRPIIIAGHSQGSTHAITLLTEFFDGKPLQSQLVAAYLLGMPVTQDHFHSITPCQDSTETGCFISWRTFKQGYLPKKWPVGDSIVVTNPLSWKTDDQYMPKSANAGGVLYGFNRILPHLADAQVHDGVLWATKPKFRGSFLYWNPNFHPADINFYYFNIQHNAEQRVEAFLGRE
ncbi:MAG: DUF3089 domain-containing protein [Saprospiraceae bacterium]|nr:DUF3089 domain-containing protein [Saprospiraceae bacterium]MCB9326033.1 DUF3089 domain-containing protein [Lewinellaceae bacterium]